uniref:TF-B3 domain-containing protein n=1 Tax=Manihot esculenta TaxID=3983 RepID=A0A2C9VK02_MANES
MEFEATSADNIHEHWNFRLCCERYRKPELTGDWLQFVSSKNLCKGNKIILTMELDEATGERSYTIRAEAKLMDECFVS